MNFSQKKQAFNQILKKVRQDQWIFLPNMITEYSNSKMRHYIISTYNGQRLYINITSTGLKKYDREEREMIDQLPTIHLRKQME